MGIPDMDVTMTLRSEGEAADPRQHSRTDQRRSLWSGLDQATLMSNELLAAVLTWAAIGWLLDRWLGTGPWLLVTGALIGNAAGIYLVYLRSGRMEGYESLGRSHDTTERTTDPTPAPGRERAGTVADDHTDEHTTDRDQTTPERGRA